MTRLATDAKRGGARRQPCRPDGEAARLNSFLRSGLTFSIERGPRSGELPGRREGERRGSGEPVRGVLTVAMAGGAERAAASIVVAGRSRRGRLLAIASCLADCAMALGLGAGVYEARPRRGGGEMP